MELHHEFTVPSSLADTWAAFNQLQDIAPCFPGATLTAVEGDTFTGTVKVKLGPIAMLYSGTGEFLSRDEAAHTVVIKAIGKDKRGNGTAGATVTAVMAADGDATTVKVSTDMNVTGKPAQFGRGVIQDISDKLLAQFVECIISKAGAPEAEAEPAAVEPVSPSPVVPDRGGEAGVSMPNETPPSPTPVVSTSPTTAGPASPPRAATPPQPAAELDLGATIWPVLLRKVGPFVLVAMAAAAVTAFLGRCRRRTS